MTTARAWVLKRYLRRRFRGRDRSGRGRFALGCSPVDQADDEDQPECELVDGDVAEEPGHGDVGERAERWVLAADRRIARPQEVDLHRHAPDQAGDVDRHTPAAEL